MLRNEIMIRNSLLKKKMIIEAIEKELEEEYTV